MLYSELTKVLVVILFAINVQCKTLNEDLRDFCDLMPNAQMKQIAENHVRNDKEFNEAVIFLQSETWTQMLDEVYENAEWKKLDKFLSESGVNLDIIFISFLNFVNDLKPTPNEEQTNRSLRTFFDDIELILPIGQILAMLHDKKQNSPEFQEFYKRISSHDVHEMFENVWKQPAVKKVMKELKDMGARIDDMLDLFYGFMNWDSPSILKWRSIKSALNEDIEDFNKLIPWDNLRKITNKYSANDTEFKKFALYIRSPEFEEIMNGTTKAVQDRKAYLELKKYLEDAGVDTSIDFFLDIFFIYSNKTVVKEIRKRTKGSLKDYLNEIRDSVPSEKLLDLFQEKMSKCGEFKEFVKKLFEFKKLTYDNRVIPEPEELFEKLQSIGIAIQETFMVKYAFRGFENSPIEK